MFRRRRFGSKVISFLMLTGLLFLIYVLNATLRETLYEMAEVRAVQLATDAINNAVRMKMAEQDGHYQELVEIHKDSSGRIVLVEANAVMINKMASETTLAAQSALAGMRGETLVIPVGQITGIDFLSNLGPGIKVQIVPLGTVRVDVRDRFEQAGINQTRHYIYLDYDTEVRIVIPLKSGRARVATQVQVSESIIVGDVPGTFVSLPDGLFGAGINK